MSSRLRHEVTRPADLGAETRQGMFALFARCYEGVTSAQFEQDLAGKDHVILLRSVEGAVRGFSTQQIYETTFEDETVSILFSGDTLVEPECWGSAELVKGWCAVAARALCARPDRRLFWFLISKGYRTYLYLPLFFQAYLPAPGQPEMPEHRRLLDHVAAQKFGAAYQPATSLVCFPQAPGWLSPALAGVPPGRVQDPHVKFFLERNPGYAEGVELACLAEVALENTHGLGRRWLGRALEEENARRAAWKGGEG